MTSTVSGQCLSGHRKRIVEPAFVMPSWPFLIVADAVQVGSSSGIAHTSTTQSEKMHGSLAGPFTSHPDEQGR